MSKNTKILKPITFCLSVIECTPQERLKELQQIYNSMEFEQDTNLNRKRCNHYRNEIYEIVKSYPELSGIVQLNNYGF